MNIAALQAELASRDVKFQAADDGATNAAAESDSAIANLKSQLDRVNEEVRENKLKLSRLEAEAAEAQGLIAQLNGTVTQSEQEKRDLDGRLSDRLNQEAQLRAEVASLQEEAAAAREQGPAEVAALQLEVASLHQEVDLLTSQRSQLQRDGECSVSKLEEEIVRHQDEVTELKSKLDAAEDSAVELRELLAEGEAHPSAEITSHGQSTILQEGDSEIERIRDEGPEATEEAAQ